MPQGPVPVVFRTSAPVIWRALAQMVVQKEGEALQVSGCKGMLLDNAFILAESDTPTLKERNRQ